MNKLTTYYGIEASVNKSTSMQAIIDKYKNSYIKGLAWFEKGLEKDIEVVGNAVASDLSNGFVEGTNSKLKMIKPTIYGRCSIYLLKVKQMYVSKETHTDNCR